MQYRIEKNSREPAYMQLYVQLRRDIVRGAYPYGSRLPSKRLVASEVGVSVITVEHAYAILCDEGYAEAKERSGFFVCYRDSEVFPVAESTEKNLISGGGMERTESRRGEEMPYGILAKTMRRVLTVYGEKILESSPGAGLMDLRQVIAAYLARGRGIFVGPEQIVIGSGSEYLYGLVVQTVGRDRIFALEDPSYDKIRRMYEANGVHCELLRMGKDGILSGALRNSKASVLHVTPFNSYPSGITATASKRREYIRWAKRRNGLIIEDDFDSEFTVLTKAEDTLFSLEPEQTVIYINTFTQTIGPSMRVGYMILPEKLLPAFRERAGFYACTVPTFEQYVLLELIQSGDFERHINRVRRARRKSFED